MVSTRSSFKAVTFAGLVFGVLFGIPAVRLKTGSTFRWDQVVLERLQDGIPHAQDLIWPTILVGPLGAVIAVIVLLRRKRPLVGGFWAAAVGGIVMLDPLLKEAIARPAINPSSGGYSFPSGSAMVLLAASIALVATVPMARSPLVLLAVSAIVISQGAMLVSIRWHYPSDVLAGWAIAAAWVAFVWLGIHSIAATRLRRERRSTRSRGSHYPG